MKGAARLALLGAGPVSFFLLLQNAYKAANNSGRHILPRKCAAFTVMAECDLKVFPELVLQNWWVGLVWPD